MLSLQVSCLDISLLSVFFQACEAPCYDVIQCFWQFCLFPKLHGFDWKISRVSEECTKHGKITLDALSYAHSNARFDLHVHWGKTLPRMGTTEVAQGTISPHLLYSMNRFKSALHVTWFLDQVRCVSCRTNSSGCTKSNEFSMWFAPCFYHVSKILHAECSNIRLQRCSSRSKASPCRWIVYALTTTWIRREMSIHCCGWTDSKEPFGDDLGGRWTQSKHL